MTSAWTLIESGWELIGSKPGARGVLCGSAVELGVVVCSADHPRDSGDVVCATGVAIGPSLSRIVWHPPLAEERLCFKDMSSNSAGAATVWINGWVSAIIFIAKRVETFGSLEFAVCAQTKAVWVANSRNLDSKSFELGSDQTVIDRHSAPNSFQSVHSRFKAFTFLVKSFRHVTGQGTVELYYSGRRTSLVRSGGELRDLDGRDLEGTEDEHG